MPPLVSKLYFLQLLPAALNFIDIVHEFYGVNPKAADGDFLIPDIQRIDRITHVPGKPPELHASNKTIELKPKHRHKKDFPLRTPENATFEELQERLRYLELEILSLEMFYRKHRSKRDVSRYQVRRCGVLKALQLPQEGASAAHDPARSCYTNERGFACCNEHLERFAAKQQLNALENSSKGCNLQRAANQLQASAERTFGAPFEVVVVPSDFASRTHFVHGLLCKVEQSGNFALAYAAPQQRATRRKTLHS